MYEIKLINESEITTIHYPTADSEAPHLLSAKLKRGINQIENVRLSIPFNNPGYNKIYEMRTAVMVVDTRTDKVVFEGRVLLAPHGMDSSGKFEKSVVVEGELGYFNDSHVRKWEINNMSVGDFLQMILDNHNAQVEEYKHFQLGEVEISENLFRETNYEPSMNIIADKLVNKLGGEIQIRKENGVRYLDYLSQIGRVNSTAIRLGWNMKDMELEKDPTAIITRLIPLGADGLTIADVNNGNDYIDNEAAISQVGIIEGTYTWNDVTLAENLLTKARAKLDNELSKMPRKLKITAYDLSLIGLDIESFGLGDDVPIVNPVMAVDEYFRVIEQEIDLLQPHNSSLTFDNKFDSLTLRQISMQLTTQKINSMLTEGGIRGDFLRGAVDLTKAKMQAMVDVAEKHNAMAILFEDTIIGSPTYGAMAIGTKGFMIASEKINGVWDWRTFGTGQGFIADLIIAGKILGNNAEFNLDEGYLKVNHLDGSYSKLDASGLKHYNAGIDKNYHYLAYTNEGYSGTGYDDVVIQLPDEFKGKDFVPTVALSSIGSGSSSLAVSRANVLVPFGLIDIPNGRFTVRVDCLNVNTSTNELERGACFFVYYAIA